MAIDIIARGMIESSKNDISQLFDLSKGGESVNGSSSYALNNAVDYPLLGLNLYGKSTQDGIPTPTAPVGIVSVGDGGSVDVKSYGKNLLNYDAWKTNNVITHGTAIFENNGISITATENDAYTQYSYNAFPKLARVFVIKGETITLSWKESTNTSGLVYIFPNGKADGIVSCNNNTQKKLTYTVPSGVSFITFRFGVGTAGDTISYKNIMIERGSESTEYEPYKGSTASITSALPLCGIPVDSGGNYTDSNGQQWICDKLIYNADGTGKIIKRCKKIRLESSNIISFVEHTTFGNYFYTNVTSINIDEQSSLRPISNAFEGVKFSERTQSDYLNNFRCFISTDGRIMLRNSVAENDKFPTLESMQNFVASNDVYIIYPLAEPQEIELTAAEVDALRTLQTFDGTTSISNNSGAEMSVKYCTNKMLSECVLPITMGLQKQIDELRAAILSMGGNV